VGTLSFKSKGSVGATSFSATTKKGGAAQRTAFLAAVISAPTVAAIATALANTAPVVSSGVAFRLPAAVTMALLSIYYWTTLQVSVARHKFGVPPPATSGNADFERVFRAQYNALEGLPIILPALWLSAALIAPLPAAVAGAVYCAGRVSYSLGYYADVKKRGSGFMALSLAQLYLMVLASIGVARQFL